MITLNKTTLGIAAGVAGTLFLGYCIYFDNKRRSDPDFKKKVRERRRRARKNGQSSGVGMLNLDDPHAIERYFMKEIQLGEQLIGRGDFEAGVEHLANAIVVCGQPAKLLQVLQTTLPAQVFAMLIGKMREFGNRAEANDGPKLVASNPMVADISSMGSLDGHDAVMIDDLE